MENRGIAERVGISEDQVSSIRSHFFRYLKSQLTSKEAPTIKLKHIGTFHPAYNRVKHLLLYKIKAIRDGIDVDQNKKDVSSLWKVRNSLIKQRKIRL